jgi:hypothetical protein
MIGAAQAEVGLTTDVGTTGAGIRVDVPLGQNLSARFGTSYLSHSYHRGTSSLDYDLKRTFKSVDALLDWYPVNDHGFRLSGGLVYKSDKSDVLARPESADHYTIQGNSYSAASTGRIEGRISQRKIAPYFGIGWGKAPANERKGGWSVSADLGVLLQGTPNASLTSSGCTSPTAPCSQLAADLAKESEALVHETGKYKAYPVLRVGFRYQF